MYLEMPTVDLLELIPTVCVLPAAFDLNGELRFDFAGFMQYTGPRS